MSDEASATPSPSETGAQPTGAVLVGVVAGQSPRVVKEAARYAKAFGVPLLVVNVDVTRFVAYEDPDGSVQTAAIDLAAVGRESEVKQVTDETSAALEGCDVEWSLRWLVGDPALAMKKLADEVRARLIVVGTRKQGLGESIREFFTGSVAVRLAHRQTRPVLVVPTGQLLDDDQDFEG
ncbi:universal stress protein [Microbacterium protaetiae]|uniref:Universal stress protein n=1 Tax=Microbacterium protaetiae TaxID=2509458 RepID=A0A4P6EDQ3_9MICO|nr:universal stress protein [Microbacterium protaetiae]QAY59866.1 universal stress protein [Microbacterium protaetiae]